MKLLALICSATAMFASPTPRTSQDVIFSATEPCKNKNSQAWETWKSEFKTVTSNQRRTSWLLLMRGRIEEQYCKDKTPAEAFVILSK